MTPPPSLPRPEFSAEKPLEDAAADQLRTWILTGVATPGSDLPGERELAAQLGVSRLTVRAALARLESERLVRRVHGSGTRVLDFRETGGIELLGHMAACAQSGDVLPLRLLADLLELRRVVAVEILALVAERVTADEIEEIERRLRVLDTLVAEPRRFMIEDIALARFLVKATHNLALGFLANTIVRVLEDQPGVEAAFAIDPKGAVAVYRRILILLRAGDAHLVRKLARRLMLKLDRHLLERLSGASPAGSTPSDDPSPGTPGPLEWTRTRSARSAQANGGA